MNKETSFFYTDWSALTVNDWAGIIVTVIVSVVLIAAYTLIFHPKNKERLESQRYLIDGLDGEPYLADKKLHGATNEQQ
jgi:cytochrome c oxidase cbb3-type subunit 4